MKTTTKTKGLAWLLSLMMIVALMPGLVFAEGEQPDGITFTASVDGVNLDVGTAIENGYKGGYSETTVDLYSLTIPIGTEAVDLQFHRGDSAANCLAYNYAGTGGDPVDAGAYLSGSVDDTTIGVQQYRAAIDSDSVDYNTGSAIPADGFFDYIQVQNLYNTDWSGGGELFYAITFRYDVFNAFIKGQAISKITKTENGYTPYEWDNDAQAMRPGQKKVPLYTVTLSSNTEEVELEFSEACYPYSYTFDGTYISGNYSEGVNHVTAAVDGNQDGEADYIQVQTPYIQNEAGDWVSEVLYAVTFDGVELTGEEPGDITAGELVHNMAERFVGTGTASHSQAPWLTADMMAYEKAFPNSKNKLTEAQKKAMTDTAIEGLDEAQSAGDVAKYVIALVSMGVDPSALTNALGKPLDGVEKLNGMVFDGKEVIAPSYFEYTLPYVLMAYQQLEGTESLQQALVEKALELQDAWMDTQGGLDAMTPMMLALVPYQDTNEAVQGALSLAMEKATETGALNNAASDGLAAAAFAALGMDPAAYVQDLLAFTNSNRNGFGSDFDDEEGFRGLVATFLGQGERVYDFSGQALKPADSSKWNTKFTVVPENSVVKVTKGNEENEVAQVIEGSNAYLLEEGEYHYTVSCQGYTSKTGTINVSNKDVESGKKFREYVSLTKEKPASSEPNTVDVTVRVLAHDKATCNNTVTYKNDPDKYSSLLKKESYTATLVKNEGTARDALVEALDDSGITYEEVSNGYFPTIGEYTEFGHGSNSGWLYMVNGKAGTSAMKDVTFSRNGTLTVFFTDDYSKDYGSESWGPEPKDDQPDDPGDDPVEKDYYDDTKGHWAEDAINQITEKGLMNGVAKRKFAPDVTLSRAMFVTMLYRLEKPSQSAAQTALPEGEPRDQDSSVNSKPSSPRGVGGTDEVGDGEGASGSFADVESGSWYEEAVLWGVKNGIVKGTSDTTFSPDAPLTREQMAVFLYRYKIREGRSETGEDPSASPQNDISAIGSFTDADQVSSWAEEAVTWAVANGIINGVSEKKLQPKGTATRAQAATILLRYIDKHSL